MIIVALKGGLGNQMFQYALGRKLALVTGDALALDLSQLDRAIEVGDVHRPFALGTFPIKASVATPEEIARIKHPYGLLSKLVRWFSSKVLRQMHVGWEPGVLTGSGDRYFDGYWQSPKYCEAIRPALLEDFTAALSPEARTLAHGIGETDSVSIHVRRGDYVANPMVRVMYGPCSLDYYARAVREIEERVLNPSWFVFSDDIAWVRKNLQLPKDTTYVSGQSISDVEELMLMAACKHAVIANSSFSWWGAWLNRNTKKVVVAPLPWFDTRTDGHKDLIPASWIRIPKHQHHS
ncbi:MAG: alpha-1,2-fucosyltransferase [bacterium]|nr:alpha-1,2-fucosyltransferase [bacterium]